MSVCYRLSSKTIRPNCMKFSGMICHHPRTSRLDFGIDQVKGQGQGHKGLKNYWTELHEIFRDDMLSSKDQLIRFWERSGQRSRSWKGKNLIFVIMRSIFVRFIWNQHQNVHFSIPYPLISQRSRSLKGQKHILVITSSVFFRFIWNQLQNIYFSILYPLMGQRSRSRSLKGQKHISVITRSFSSDSYENNAKMFTFQFPILWFGDKCGVGEGMCSTEGNSIRSRERGHKGGRRSPWKLKYVQFRWNLNHIIT